MYLNYTDFVGSHFHPPHFGGDEESAQLGHDQHVSVSVVECPVDETS